MDVAKTPEEWLQFIYNERKTHRGASEYKYWLQLYRRAADSIPANEFAHNNNAYAKIMVDFAKLQARTSEHDARAIFQAARSNVKHCSLIYVAWAQFELSNNNRKKCKKLLEKGKQFCAKPEYLLDTALENFKSGNDQLIDDETEEYTFTELIHSNISKTEDLTDHIMRTKQRTSDSSIESTSSVGPFSPESKHLSELSEESDEVVFVEAVMPSKTTKLPLIEELQTPQEDARPNATPVSESKSKGQQNVTDLHSSFLDGLSTEEQFNKPAVSIGEGVTRGNKHTTTNPTYDITLQQLSTHCSTEAELADFTCSTAESSLDNTLPKPGKDNFSKPPLPDFPPTTNVTCDSSGNTGSKDGIDALDALKKSLLNIGNKTGLMDFATPQNKNPARVWPTTSDANFDRGSLVKERKSNRKAKRSVLIGLPQRVPKPLGEKPQTRLEEQQGASDENKKIVATLTQTKAYDCIDGVYAIPQNGEEECIFESIPDISTSDNKRATHLPPSNKQGNKEMILKKENDSIDVVYTFPQGMKTNPNVSEHSSDVRSKDYISKSNNFVNKISATPIFSDNPLIRNNKENVFGFDCNVTPLVPPNVSSSAVPFNCAPTVSGHDCHQTVSGGLSSPSVDQLVVENLRHDCTISSQIDNNFSQTGSCLRQRMPLASVALNPVKNTTNLVSFHDQYNPLQKGVNPGQIGPKICPVEDSDFKQRNKLAPANIVAASTTPCSKSLENLSSSVIAEFRPFCGSTPGIEKANEISIHNFAYSAHSTQGMNYTTKPHSELSQMKEEKNTKSAKACKDLCPSSQAFHSEENFSNSQHPSLIAQTFPEVSTDIETSSCPFTNDSKSKPVSLTIPNNTGVPACNNNFKPNHSTSGVGTFVKNMSQIGGPNSGAIENITVNGKVYSKLNRIGRGGSSEVYAVFDSDYTQYALKYVDIRSVDAVVVESYVNEITLLKRLQGHESIVKLHDWEMDQVNKVIKIVLELGSTDLAGYLKKNPDKITTDFIKICWKKMLDAVDVIHNEGIIHTDLKPANFLLVEWNLKLIDFGIANAIQGDVTSFYRGSTVGTVNYMSPESLNDGSQTFDQSEQHKPMMKIGRPSDVWSLGCILYSMVYGKTPFQDIKNSYQKWSCIVDPSYEIKFPHIENQDLLDCMKGCLMKNPGERYTIAQLRNHPFLTGRTSANDVDNVVSCLIQMQGINSPRTLRTIAQSLVGYLSSGSSLN